jgi:energy-coupling factor transporter transmembrane protein EcfT
MCVCVCARARAWPYIAALSMAFFGVMLFLAHTFFFLLSFFHSLNDVNGQF